ncbi:hypothetical protein DRQ09_02465 [candidate division KSB1 bacterium]|nr:MAG: hypothetical protein DRQ09_02465 [candidate division KSB1 bacterium]
MLKRVLVIFVLLFSFGELHSQVKDPKIPRSWWKNVKNYIDGKANNFIMVFDTDSVTNQNIAIFHLNQGIQINRIDIMTESVLDSPTVFYFYSGSLYDSVLVDSSVVDRYYFSVDTVYFPALPCTLKFSDTIFTSRVKGGGGSRIVIQYTNR